MTKKESKSTDSKELCRKCPYCDMELESSNVGYCPFCKFKFSHCLICSYPVTDKMEKCPNCGAKL